MPINLVAMYSSLQIKYAVGVDENGNMVTRTRTINRLRDDVDPEDIYEIAMSFSNLQKHDLASLVLIHKEGIEYLG